MPSGHHYVPQFYLRQFKVHGTKSNICTYFRDGKIVRKNIKNIANKGHVYNFVDKNGEINREIEAAFSVIENDNQAIIEKLLDNESSSLLDKEHSQFSYFISTMYTRGLAYRNKLTSLYEATSKTMMGLTADSEEAFHRTSSYFMPYGSTAEQIESARKDYGNYKIEHDARELLHFALRSADTLYPYILDKKMCLLKASGESSFITSDNPVIICHSSPRKGSHIIGNGGAMHSNIFLTLSPKYCILMSIDPTLPDSIAINDEDVREINHLLIFYANKMVFADAEYPEVKDGMTKTQAGAGQATVVQYAGETNVYNSKFPGF